MTTDARPLLDAEPDKDAPTYAFRTKSECWQHAAWCERMAAAVVSEGDRALLLETAAHWRTLAEHAKA